MKLELCNVNDEELVEFAIVEVWDDTLRIELDHHVTDRQNMYADIEKEDAIAMAKQILHYYNAT